MGKAIHKNKKTKELIIDVKPINTKNYYYALALIVFLVFANTISGGYNLDDELVTVNHRFTSQGLSSVKDIFTNSYYADDMGYAYGYRPMVLLSFAIEHQFFGESPNVSHFFNVLLYALSVVLFFKILLKWFGIEQLKLAFLAVMLFGLHPVHTEVVASIKNRDEILAFLFILLSGLSMIKYLEKGKLSSLIWLIALFSMAMLSKKSAYPLAIVLPIAIVLFRNISSKQLTLISLLVIIPAAFIGSELNILRMILMLIIPVFGIMSIYFIKTMSKKEISAFFSKPYIPTAIIILIAGWSLHNWSFNGLLFIIPFVFWLFRISFQAGLITVIIVSIGVGLKIGYVEFLFLTVLITVGYNLFLATQRDLIEPVKGKIRILWTSLLVISIIIDLANVPTSIEVFKTISFVLFFWLVFKRPVWGIIFALIAIIGVLIAFDEINFLGISTLSFSVLYFFKNKLKSFNWINIFVAILFSCLVAFFWYEKYQFNQTQTPATEITAPVSEIIKDPENNSFLKEGRELEFVENTLVSPHTTQETIGTGAATLGEYFRLMVFPYELSFYYGFARMETVSLANPFVWSSILVHLGLIFLAIWNLRKRPIISVGIIWYLFSIILFSNWLELVAGMVAERLAFIASAGFSIFLAGMVFWLKPQFLSKKPFMLEGLIAIVLILFTVKTIHRNTSWKDPITLMGSDINHLKNSAQANNLYANNLVVSTFNPESNLTQEEKKVRYHLALKHYGQALQVYPNFYNAAFDRGRLSEIVQDTSLAIQSYKQAIEMQQSNFPDPFYNLCNIYLNKGDFSNYLKYAKPLIYFDSLNIQAYSNLARAYYLNNKKDSATFVLKRAITLFPEDLELKQSIEFLNQQEN